jgi:hypothetical protein
MFFLKNIGDKYPVHMAKKKPIGRFQGNIAIFLSRCIAFYFNFPSNT